jgi:sugar fermentation stimulation protein A
MYSYPIPWHQEAIFLNRPNRFVLTVEFRQTKRQEIVHLHDPGRLGELLLPNARILLQKSHSPNRKTAYDVIAIRNFQGDWVLVHSGFHSKIIKKILQSPCISPFGSVEKIQSEVQTGHSRLDFCLTKQAEKIWIEVKGCSLKDGLWGKFPDAPTLRGTKHVEELIALRKQGDRAAIIFLVTAPKVRYFTPFTERDPVFSTTFQAAVASGVEVYPLCFRYDKQSQTLLYTQKILPLKGQF